jgi:UTP--glucose-1-phosphate uridylyltransferase
MTYTAKGMNASFRTAVVPAAGLGTRFLPASKSVPKELLPVVDTPCIELVADEAAQAGAETLVVVTAPGKDGVVGHFVDDPVLERALTDRGKTALLEKVRKAPRLLAVRSVVQERPLGLGHAVLQAEQVLDDDESSIAVLLPDDLVLPCGVLDAMTRVRKQLGGTVLCAVVVPADEVSAYGIFEVEQLPGSADADVLRVVGMVEKPAAEDAPSRYAAAGRYILDRAIFDALREISPGTGGELQLTDAIAKLIAEGHPVHVVVHHGTRHDLGNPAGYLRAVVDVALNRVEYGLSLREWLVQRLSIDDTNLSGAA